MWALPDDSSRWGCFHVCSMGLLLTKHKKKEQTNDSQYASVSFHIFFTAGDQHNAPCSDAHECFPYMAVNSAESHIQLLCFSSCPFMYLNANCMGIFFSVNFQLHSPLPVCTNKEKERWNDLVGPAGRTPTLSQLFFNISHNGQPAA